MFSSETRVITRLPSESKRQKRVSKIPVIKYFYTETNLEQHETFRQLDLSRVIHLFEDPLTRSMKERHIFALKKVVKRYQKGFLLRDLADVFKLLNLCAEKSLDLPEYAAVLCDLLHICRLPFLKEKASDEINYTSVVTDSLAQMGYLMRVPHPKVKEQICASITSLYSLDKSKHFDDGVYPTSLAYRQKLVEGSGLAETLVMSLALLEKQVSTKLHVLQTLQALSSSPTNCSLMLKAEAAQKICFHMNEPDESGQVLFRSSEILWNLLENGSKEEVTVQLSSIDCITVLKEAFWHQLLHGFRHYDHQLRNDLLVITTLIAENPNATLIESGFAKQLVLLATVPELKSHNPLVRKLKLTFTAEDFEMKKMLLNLLVVLSRDLSAVQLFKECRVLLALMLLVRPGSRDDGRPGGRGGRRSWTAAQQEELQLQALAVLATLAPLMLDELVSCQANTCLLMLLEWCTQKDGFFALGHGFHSTGARGGKKAHVRYCVRLLRCMAYLNDSLVKQDLCDQGALNQLLGLLKQFQDKEGGEEDAVSVEIQTDVLITLSALCDGDMHRKELLGAEGVEAAVYYLKTNPATLYNGHGHNRLLLATLDFIWSCVVSCFTTEDLFLEKEGVFLLLDFLHVCPRSMQNVALGTLLELCDNPKALSHAEAWRGQRELTAPALLLRLWRQDESKLRVQRDEHGGVADVKKPLMSVRQDKQPIASIPTNQPSPAVLDVSENLRAKIYSMFCKLGFENLPGLDTGDYVTLSIVNRYLDFKIGEVWSEVSAELELEGVRPVTPDAEALVNISKTSEDTAKHVCLLQQRILERREQADLQEETLAYKEISLTRKQKELTAQVWEHYVAKTSDYKILQESKLQQKLCIEASRAKARTDAFNLHSAQNPGLQTTS